MYGVEDNEEDQVDSQQELVPDGKSGHLFDGLIPKSDLM